MKKLTFKNNLSLEGYHTVTLDEPFKFLPENANGLYAEGVSASIVFAVYHQNELLMLQHWGNIPSVFEDEEVVEEKVEIKIDQIERILEDNDYETNQCKVYAFGGQPSSRNVVSALKSLQENGYPTFELNTKGLDLIENDEDMFDICVPRGKPRFEVKVVGDSAGDDKTMLTAYSAHRNAAQDKLEDVSERKKNQRKFA